MPTRGSPPMAAPLWGIPARQRLDTRICIWTIPPAADDAADRCAQEGRAGEGEYPITGSRADDYAGSDCQHFVAIEPLVRGRGSRTLFCQDHLLMGIRRDR